MATPPRRHCTASVAAGDHAEDEARITQPTRTSWAEIFGVGAPVKGCVTDLAGLVRPRVAYPARRAVAVTESALPRYAVGMRNVAPVAPEIATLLRRHW